MKPEQRVAVVGMAGVFAGAPDLDALWSNVRCAVDASSESPAGRWVIAPASAFDPRPGASDRVYSTRGYFLGDFRPDLAGLEIDPGLVAQLDPLFQLVVHAGGRAFREARMGPVDRARVGVILGNICLPTEKISQLAWEYLGAPIRRALGLPEPPKPTNPLNRFVAGLPAALLSRALGLGGPAFCLDAACASSLYAVSLAADALLEGRADAVLAGGACRPDCLYTQMGFAQLRALSASGRCSPFDQAADGLMVGEGCGVFVLKRLDDALRHGDRVLGVIAGAGLSNDVGGNLLAPAREGQLRAMRAAYRQAGWRPDEIDLVECHATGTPLGDSVEFSSLRELWADQGDHRSCVIGSVKSTVGHLLTGAGAAGLAKVLLAMRARTLPPTANFRQPAGAIALADSPFRVLAAPEAWEARGRGVPRRAALSGFGFGGINAHLLVEEWVDESPAPATGSTMQPPSASEPIAIVGMAARFGADENVEALSRRFFAPAEASTGAPGPIAEVSVPLDRFRIPPKEVEEMLPQQALALLTADEALRDCVGQPGDRDVAGRTGVFLGVTLDCNTTNFHLRWAAGQAAVETVGLGDADERTAAGYKDAAGPPLSANRTMGALASIAASRVARVFGAGGPSFTVSDEEAAGLRALDVAVGMLRRGVIDRALVGAVDLPSDPRDERARTAATGKDVAGQATDGSVTLVLKRLTDARRDRDRVYAVIQAVGSAGDGGGAAAAPSADAFRLSLERACRHAAIDPASVTYRDVCSRTERAGPDPATAATGDDRLRRPHWVGSANDVLGNAGCTTGLAAVLRASVALYHSLLPLAGDRTGDPSDNQRRAGRPARDPQFWLSDRAAGPRRAGVTAGAVGGGCVAVVLEEAPGGSDETRPRSPIRGAEGLFLLSADTPGELGEAAGRLGDWTGAQTLGAVDELARRWRGQSADRAPGRYRAAVVARSREETASAAAFLRQRLLAEPARALPDDDMPGPVELRDRVFYSPEPLAGGGSLAFVFPGSGNHYGGMGCGLAAHFPAALRRQHAENEYLRSQYAADELWDGNECGPVHPRTLLFAQVAFGTLVSEVLGTLGVRPEAVLGYSLGESASLFALRAWRDRDRMLQRMQRSTLFESDLAAPFNAARAAWDLPPGDSVDWVTGVVGASADEVRRHLRGSERGYLLIVNAPNECVVGGHRPDAEALARRIGKPLLEVRGVTLAHCDAAAPVAGPYWDLHHLPTTPPPGVRFYSGAWGRPYAVESESAADSILAGLLETIDFPRVVRQAYADGARFFLEVGPGGSCTRMIDAVLGDSPHRARAVTLPRQDEFSLLLRALGQLHAEGFSLDLAALYGQTAEPRVHEQGPSLRLPVGYRPGTLPALLPAAHFASTLPDPPAADVPHVVVSTVPAATELPVESVPTAVAGHINAQAEVTRAHEAFLRFSTSNQRAAAAVLGFQTRLLQQLVSDHHEHGALTHVLAETDAGVASPPAGALTGVESLASPTPSPVVPTGPVPLALGPEQCREFAAGSVAAALGPDFAEADTFPTRVRLPDGPLLLVDRILEVHGEPKSLSSGRVVTEHRVHEGRWYLDAGRIPTSVAVEAGQADLFLSGYLGIDFRTRGLAVYRLLDAVVTFHRPLPRPGEVILYDIAIDRFFRQGDTHLFRFRFEGTVNGEPLLTMRDGCAGFFTAAELASGKGVVQTALERRPVPGVKPADWEPPVPLQAGSLTEAQVESLRAGDLVGAFGAAFARARLRSPVRLPGGMLRLVHRVREIVPAGGRYGLGLIRAEADIHPDDWFLTCHFVDDQVMPGTLMYECCLHTLRVLLMRMGWVGEDGEVVCEPVPGRSSRLKCRGQVTASTRTVTYEVALKEFGFSPEPYAVADALMYADGKPIVEIGGMSLRMTGLTRERLERVWAAAPAAAVVSADERQAKPVLFDTDRILAFAVGKPSVAFGEPYRVFDEGRVIARLPGPPYQFLDRVTAVDAAPWKMVAGGSVEAEYDVPPDAWYFASNRCPEMPFSVLLEVALQPCGWLAAYVGSALTSPYDLSFRNLGGKGTQFASVTPATGTLTTRVELTRVSHSAGMIIQHYDLGVFAADREVYRGTTYFGFFSRPALANQVGLRDAVLLRPTSPSGGLVYPTEAPFPDTMLRMVHRISWYEASGGPAGLGALEGTIAVEPSAWFFRAHFYQDPVWPGSLGLESFLQLLKFAARQRWGASAGVGGWQAVALNREHEWVYRGQVIPSDGEVTVQAWLTAADDGARVLTADGYLSVDGRTIYQMKRFTLQG